MQDFQNFLIDKNNEYGTKNTLKLFNNVSFSEKKFKEEDKITLKSISLYAIKTINILEEMNDLLKTYNKINNKPINIILEQLKVYNESIINELNKI